MHRLLKSISAKSQCIPCGSIAHTASWSTTLKRCAKTDRNKQPHKKQICPYFLGSGGFRDSSPSTSPAEGPVRPLRVSVCVSLSHRAAKMTEAGNHMRLVQRARQSPSFIPRHPHNSGSINITWFHFFTVSRDACCSVTHHNPAEDTVTFHEAFFFCLSLPITFARTAVLCACVYACSCTSVAVRTGLSFQTCRSEKVLAVFLLLVRHSNG